MNKGGVFVIGAAIGAAAGLLLSPHSGSKNREILNDTVAHYGESAEQVVIRATENLRERRDAVEGGAGVPATEDIRVKINEARDRIAEQVTRNRKVEDVEADVSDVAEAAEDIADDIAATAPAPAEGDEPAAPAEGAAPATA